ncbi:MAG: hypothetical protein ABIS06_15925 [Vicinamibacterales bacterium]
MRFLAVVLILLGPPAPSLVQADGAFTLRATGSEDRVNLNLQFGDGNSNYGRTIERSAFTVTSQRDGQLTITLKRDPGTFTLEGRGSIDRASGWYEFAPNPAFQKEIEGLGFRQVTDRALFVFALDDLTIEGVKQLQRLVSNTFDTDELVRLINHGAGLRHIQSMTDAGFSRLTTDQYRRARDHGVSADFARGMADLGIKLSLEDLIRSRDHGVSLDYVTTMRASGFDVSHEDLVSARDHGISSDFLKQMSALGYDKLPLGDYVRMRDHGVTAGYVKRIQDLLKERPSVEQLISLRNGGDVTRR